ncbi:NAD(+)/NADH kinase [Patescibacteria group bacterium]|nr:NAD(+)/NADH kinase [Patescibacteria group bacterium]
MFGKEKDAIAPLVQKCGFEIVAEHPDVVVSYGGDGTLMQAEHQFPGIPKIILKNSLVAKKASVLSNEEVLKRVCAGQYRIEEFWKLQASFKNSAWRALNDIVVHNKNPRHAIRYAVSVNGKEIRQNIIGDGMVAATPFGSSGYYRSITDSFFEIGIGIAFNNSTEQSDHMVLKEDSIITATIMRGPAVVYADNQEHAEDMREGDTLTIQKSSDVAKIISV